ncbi:acetolactate synthase small subunit [Jatrophihabitans fulvus]
MTEHTITVSGQGGLRLLSAVCGVLRHRGADLSSMTCSHGATGELHLSLVVTADAERDIELLLKQLNRVVGVARTVHVTERLAHRRRLVLVRVRADDAHRGQVLDVARAFGAEILEVCPTSMSVALTADPRRVADFLDVLAPFGVTECIDGGTTALRTGSTRGVARRPHLSRVVA